MEIHISGEPQEIAALVLGIQERQDQDIQIDEHTRSGSRPAMAAPAPIPG